MCLSVGLKQEAILSQAIFPLQGRLVKSSCFHVKVDGVSRFMISGREAPNLIKISL